nr:hypothetical protein CFP56_16721 [Quercus suber]
MEKCVDRSTRLGPYGFTTNINKSISSNDWIPGEFADQQQRCVVQRRDAIANGRMKRGPRTAVVLRAWNGFKWTADDIYNTRAIFAELSLSTGSRYEVFILLHVRNSSDTLPIDDQTLEDVKKKFVPKELVGLTEMWSYSDVEAAYPEVGQLSVYNHTFMPVQLFSQRHPEYDFIWNWEMDVRYTGHYGRLFSAMESWARKQPASGLLDRNTRFYIPSFHGLYENYSSTSGSSFSNTMNPTMSCTDDSVDGSQCKNLGEEPHLITLFPSFNVTDTHWPHRDYVISCGTETSQTRYGTVGTNMRLSRNLLAIMHDENKAGCAMMSEMWPTTLAVRDGLRAVFVPQTVFMDKRWSAAELHRVFNAGLDDHVGGFVNTVIDQEQNFRGSTWFWNAKFASKLYSAWLGLAEKGPGSAELCCYTLSSLTISSPILDNIFANPLCPLNGGRADRLPVLKNASERLDAKRPPWARCTIVLSSDPAHRLCFHQRMHINSCGRAFRSGAQEPAKLFTTHDPYCASCITPEISPGRNKNHSGISSQKITLQTFLAGNEHSASALLTRTPIVSPGSAGACGIGWLGECRLTTYLPRSVPSSSSVLWLCKTQVAYRMNSSRPEERTSEDTSDADAAANRAAMNNAENLKFMVNIGTKVLRQSSLAERAVCHKLLAMGS